MRGGVWILKDGKKIAGVRQPDGSVKPVGGSKPAKKAPTKGGGE